MKRPRGPVAPQRTCVGCRRVAPKAELVRLVVSSDGSIAVDRTGSAPGRGAYVCSTGECVERAVKGSRISRALRARVDRAHVERLRQEFV